MAIWVTVRWTFWACSAAPLVYQRLVAGSKDWWHPVGSSVLRHVEEQHVVRPEHHSPERPAAASAQRGADGPPAPDRAVARRLAARFPRRLSLPLHSTCALCLIRSRIYYILDDVSIYSYVIDGISVTRAIGITNRPPLPPVRVPDAVRPRANRVSLGAPEQRAVKLGLWLQWRGVNLGRSAPLFDRGVRGLWRLPGDGASSSAAPAPAFLHSLRRMPPFWFWAFRRDDSFNESVLETIQCNNKHLCLQVCSPRALCSALPLLASCSMFSLHVAADIAAVARSHRSISLFAGPRVRQRNSNSQAIQVFIIAHEQFILFIQCQSIPLFAALM